MNPVKFISTFFLIALTTASALAGSGTVEGWFQAGTDIDGYTIGTEKTDHGVVAFIKSKNPVKDEFGTLMQSFSADQYLGKRIRLSADIKHADIQEWAGMWMRVDARRFAASFDNMQNRPLKGTADWKTHHIVLDVPKDSKLISIGILLSGEGNVYWDDIKIEIVSKDEQLTDLTQVKSGPANLNFSQ